jgi:uncharacterized membrane protein
MIRKQLIERAKHKPTDFRWRGGDVSRLEGFSDNVFGFALTLLVVSLEVPKTFGELAATMRGFLGFAVCFALLAVVWHDHYSFFRRYGLNDATVTVLNLIMLFLVLFYVYPLKFLFTFLISVFTGLTPAGGRPFIEGHQMPALMMIYGAGFVSIYLIFVLLYCHAYRKRKELDLNELETFDTRASIGSDLVLVAIGFTSILIAWRGGSRFAFLSGSMYWLIGLAMMVFWTIAGTRRRPLERAAMEASGHAEILEAAVHK